jgi:hypothetical protein
VEKIKAKRYNVLTWDTKLQKFTADELSVPTQNINRKQVLRALSELRSMGYGCYADELGPGDGSDPSVVVVELA